MDVLHRKKHQHYTPDEEEFIRDNYIKYSDRWIARSMERTVDSVNHKRRTMNLHKNRGRIGYVQYEKEPINVSELVHQIKALEYYISVTDHVIWKEIAEARRIELKEILKLLNK